MRVFFHVTVVVCAVAGTVLSIPWYTSGVEERVKIAHAEPLFIVEKDALSTLSPSASAWMLFDVESGETLAVYEGDAVRPIASVSKLITALVAHTELDPATTTQVSQSVVATEGRAGQLSVGDILTNRELLFPLLLESSNDAAEVLAQEGGDREAFMTALNAKVHTLGLSSTYLEDPSGLSPHNISSVKDLAVLLRHLFVHERYLLDITMLPSYAGEAHEWGNNNPVVHEEGYLGGKHGFTPEAGRTFAGIFEEDLAGGAKRPLGIVLLGSKDIKKDVLILRAYAQSSVTYTSSN